MASEHHEHHENGNFEEMKSAPHMGNGNGMEQLSRQMTVPLSPEVYERLFFQPTAARGDLSKRLGNPTLLGLMGFLIPFQTTMFVLLEWKGASASSLTAISGSMYFLGGIAMNVAAIFELILGNTFPGAVFMIYGSHWVNLGYSNDPLHNIAGSYTAEGVPGALNLPYNSGTAMYDVTMTLISFVFFIGSLRTNAPFALAIFCLIPLFGLLAAGQFYIGYNPTEAGVAHASYLIQIGAGFGFITAIAGWYLAIITVCASVGLPCPLPIFDLSQKFGAKSEAAKLEHAGNANRVAGEKV